MMYVKSKFSDLVYLIDKARLTVKFCEHDIEIFTEEMKNYMDSIDNLSYNECILDDDFIYVDTILYDELIRLSNMNLV